MASRRLTTFAATTRLRPFSCRRSSPFRRRYGAFFPLVAASAVFSCSRYLQGTRYVSNSFQLSVFHCRVSAACMFYSTFTLRSS